MNNLKILGIETSTHACSAALCSGERVWARFEIAPARHTQLILPMVEELLQEAGFELKTLSAIAFAAGPGSFTGLRIACGVAQGLAFGAGLSLIPISTLQTMAQGAARIFGAKRVIPALDARLGGCYWGSYVLDEQGLMQPQCADQLTEPVQLLEHLAQNEQDGSLLIGQGWSVPEQNRLPEFPKQVDFYPNAVDLLPLARQANLDGLAIAPELAMPYYLRDNVVLQSGSTTV